MRSKLKKKGKSIFHSIFMAMLIVLGIEILLLLGTLYLGNVGTQLNQNAVDILKKQVENRQNYLERTLTDNQDLSTTAAAINDVVEERIKNGEIDIQKLDEDTNACSDIMEEINSTLISSMRHRSVTGIFVVFNSQDLDEREEGSFLPGIYIRDLDPETPPSERNDDLLLERSPIQLVKSMGISTDKAWNSGIRYKKNTENGILYPVFQAAYKDNAQLNAADYGRWTTQPYVLEGDDRLAIAYSMPLILPDGIVYGVIGIEMMTSYLETIVPYKELQNNSTGTYFLADTKDSLSDENITVHTVEASSRGDALKDFVDQEISMKRLGKNLYEMTLDKQKYYAALIMLDLDNLKYTNDTFGHDWGDEYIRQAGVCLEEGTPSGTLCSHISGDEFNLLFYGYDSQQEIRDAIGELQKTIEKRIICLPNGQELHISISGGISWYPEDSTSLGEMRKHADFAMYQIKKKQKGRIGEFDRSIYDQEFRDSQIRQEFHRFVDEELVKYYFQPLVCARTGKVLAYEALMRSELPILKRPDVVMNIAREEGALGDIERITMFHACTRFCELRDQGLIQGDELLFVNSIASQHMSEEDVQKFSDRFGDIKKQLVIEITEEESLDYKALEAKKNAPGFASTFALDDYGSGYSNEKSLLDLSPGYIKVDLSIIRDIDKNADKQQIVENIVAYAHKRGMKIVAEGLETPEEIHAVLELEVDLLQGFYLGRPEPVPKEINPEAVKVITDFYDR